MRSSPHFSPSSDKTLSPHRAPTLWTPPQLGRQVAFLIETARAHPAQCRCPAPALPPSSSSSSSSQVTSPEMTARERVLPTSSIDPSPAFSTVLPTTHNHSLACLMHVCLPSLSVGKEYFHLPTCFQSSTKITGFIKMTKHVRLKLMSLSCQLHTQQRSVDLNIRYPSPKEHPAWTSIWFQG